MVSRELVNTARVDIKEFAPPMPCGVGVVVVVVVVVMVPRSGAPGFPSPSTHNILTSWREITDLQKLAF
jgi:hypothetical protein